MRYRFIVAALTFAFAVAVVICGGINIGSPAGVVAAAVLAIAVGSLHEHSAVRALGVTIVLSGVFTWLGEIARCMTGSIAAQSWWPWLTFQPLTSLAFAAALMIVVATSDEDIMRVRPATAVAATVTAAYYDFGVDFSLVSGHPWPFYAAALSLPSLLTLLPLSRLSRVWIVVYICFEPIIVVVLCWAILVPSLKSREPAFAFLGSWLLPTFGVPAALAVLLRLLMTTMRNSGHVMRQFED